MIDVADELLIRSRFVQQICIHMFSITDCGFLNNPYGTPFVKINDTTYSAYCSDGFKEYSVAYRCKNQTEIVEKEICPPLGNLSYTIKAGLFM